MESVILFRDVQLVAGDAVDYYIFEKGVLKKVENLELRIVLKYLSALFLGLIIGCITFWLLQT